MSEGIIQKKIMEKLEDLGLTQYGFMKAQALSQDSLAYFKEREERNFTTSFEENDLLRKVNLRSEMENAQTIISVAFPYFYDAYIHKEGYFSLYTLGQDYHIVVKDYLEKVADVIRSHGYEAKVFADNNSLPERYIAYASYVGEIGKNHMLITKEYGSYVFLGEILTNLVLDTRERDYHEIPLHSICGECTNCIKACPTQILGSEYYDTKRCMSYITQSKEVPDEDLLLFKGRLFGCDTCQRSCPLNRKVKTSPIEAFRPREYMKYPNLRELLELSNQEFLKYKETSSGWRGKKLLQRNAMVELVRKGNTLDLERLPTEYLREYYHRLERLFNI
ncbi:tRNA epoxyqueuosine(34) reductase QueG [Proteiniclasticum ruminis]|uniref:Epoxyqueuosine reductase n=1 Tax=Proteiniclasticum ruminis TaxID=398199 RepID=A0A1G8H669_9CLOT|nr:tRNA epoxyqueuosine(34) reductase QueG [Proteiniclasticum ruminis]SDI02115.1 epoxyqueuosine reductase [Proteiniclasticum ruminis]